MEEEEWGASDITLTLQFTITPPPIQNSTPRLILCVCSHPGGSTATFILADLVKSLTNKLSIDANYTNG